MDLAHPHKSESATPSSSSSWRLFAVHLRLPFQFMLAPIFLLGALLGGAVPSFGLLVAFIAVHIGIYGGMTAFNSYYDRDEGPIGFLKHPKQPTRFVRDAALAIQAMAVLVIAALEPAAAVPAIVLVGMGIAYSHPRWRWKASVWKSLAAVSVGQGTLAFYVGYLLAAPDRTAWSPPIVLAALASTLITVGLYPITQVYQIEEDRARGDRSLAVILGWRRALVVSAVMLGIGVAVFVAALAPRLAPLWPYVLVGGAIGLWLLLWLWSRRFEQLDPYANHDWAMGIGAVASGAFWILVVSEWMRGWA